MARSYSVSGERVVPALASEIFNVLADPAMHPVIDGSGSVRAALPNAPQRLELGSRFSMSMKLGVPYHIQNTVVEFEEGRRIAWRHFHGHRWRYELEPVPGGTLVRETFDWTHARSHLGLYLILAPWRNKRAIERTLDNLVRYFLVKAERKAA